jgi:N-acetylmuramoyl-L-alanine amidase
VPLEFILEIAAKYTPRGFQWDDAGRRLSVGGVGYNVTQVSFATAGDRTTVTLHMTEPLVYHVDTATPGLVRIKLYAGRVDVRAFSVRERRGLVNGVRAEQSERDAFVTLDVSRAATQLRVDRTDSPPQIDIVIEKGEPAEGGSDGAIQIVEGEAAGRETFQIDRVCIDAGHGGRDHGKEGAGGILEKDINLAIARAIRDRIETELGIEVVMTRDDDRMLDLVERTEIANTTGCDLFVSVHCNAWFHAGTNGFESYFLSPARSESEKALQRFENEAGGGATSEPRGDVEFILWDLVQNAYIAESSTFAEYIQREMTARLGIPSRGVKQAGFVVLQGAKMPAVLIETAFLSNPAEAKLLVDPDFQRRVADGIVASIRKMQDRYR